MDVVRAAAVVDGVVVNIELIEFGFERDGVLYVESEAASIGWAYADGVFTAPPPAPDPVPEAVTPAQAKTALYDAGLYDRAEAAVGASRYALIRIWWNSAQEWKRSDPYIYAIAVELGLDDDAVDDLFRAAGRVAR